MPRESRSARPEHVRAALEGSPTRLDTDYVDSYQIHQPDLDTPIADTLAALDDAVRAGKVREIGSREELSEVDKIVTGGHL